MVIYGLGHNDWNTLIQSILYLNRNLWLNEKNHEINCSFGYIFKTTQMSGSISGQLPWCIFGYIFTLLCQILRQIPRRNNRICGKSQSLLWYFPSVLPHQYCAHTWHWCLTITNFMRAFSAYSWEERLPHPLSHLELQKHGIFPGLSHSTHNNHKTFMLLSSFTTVNTYSLFLKREGVKTLRVM